ncbi:MAG: extracellular solute-binding protein [Clostridia bacterium]|nr:extracellular solute-binding protein [Clostridia bacterium]
MRKNRKFFAVVIALFMALSCLTFIGCGDSVSENEIWVRVFNGGYGTAWFNAIKTEFEKDNPGTTVTLKTTVDSTSQEALVQAKKSKDDIVMLNYNFWGDTYLGVLADLSDVYSAKPDGEDGKTIAEKCNPILLKHFKYDNKYYQMSWATANGSMCYNKTSLDKVLGEGNWEVPITTDQMNSVAKAMKDKGHYGYVYAGDGSECYQDTYLIPALMAQYMGYENYLNLCHGMVADEQGNYSMATSSNIYQVLSDEGIKRPYETLQEFTQYEHKYSYGIGFMDAQQIFYGWGYGSDDRLVAFMANGDWLENETKSFSNNQDIKMMKMPVISALVEKLSFYNEFEDGKAKDYYSLSAEMRKEYDDKLAEIINFVDGNIAERPAFANEEDISIVYNARNTYHSLSFMHCAAIPITSHNIDLAKKFLIYMCSEKAQRIYCETLNGLSMPYGYDYSSDSQFNGRVSSFMDSANKAFDDNGYLVNQIDYSSKIMYYGSFSLLKSCCVKFNRGTATANSLFNEIRSSYTTRWNNILRQSGYSIG